ncbi:hypothetical protein FQN54_008035 [Arachnomyces sp. PD_36]|nr:hypothetical protein FQN54_008035 [Arachnomyces sp. PD_36]
MVKFYPSLDDNLAEWCLDQSVFFVASAPLTGKHVNLSPKGLPATSFSILGPNQAAYVDATGSGNETISHLHENGRITVMFCSFLSSPRILRLFCTGRVVEWDQPEFPRMLERMKLAPIPGARAVIILDIFKVQTSCGYGVPLLSLSTDPEPRPIFLDRDTINQYNLKKSVEQTHDYQRDMNYDSLDGLPGMRAARKSRGEFLLLGDMQNWIRRHRQSTDLLFVSLLSVVTTIAVLKWVGLTTIEL